MAFARVSSCRRAAASESGSGRTGGCSLVIGFLVLEGGDDLVQVVGDLPVHLGDADVACGFGRGDDLQGGLPLGMVLREELGGSREHRASQASVDRTFLYRHRDLLGKIHALEAAPPASGGTPGPAVTCASLQADLLAAHERCVRLNARVHQLEKRLSEALGDQAWRESGLGAPADTDALSQQITHLEQQAIDLRLQLEEQGQDLAAARAANRELMAQLNTAPRHR